MVSYLAGLELGWARAGYRWYALVVATALLASLTGLLVGHRADPSSSADSTLVSVTIGIVVPLLAFALVARAFPSRLERALGPVARHGADRWLSLAGASTPALGVCILSGAMLAAITRLLGGSLSNPGVADVVTCSWIGGLSGLAYGAWFILASSVGSRAQGRWIALIVDWLFGIGTGVLALPWPRAHLRNLLGGAPPMQLDQWHASGVLALLCGIYVVLTLLRTPR